MKKFIFSKFTGLQAYNQQLYYQMNCFTGIFQHHFKPPPHTPPMYWIKPPPPSSIKFWRAPHYLSTCGKPWSFIMTKPQCSMCWLFNYFSRFVNIFLCYFFSKAGFKKWETKQNESLYTPNIFHLAQEVMFTKHTFTS